MFVSYITNKDISYKHILEAISHNKKEFKILKIRYDIPPESLANSCWLKSWDEESPRFNREDCVLHRLAYSNVVISNHIDDRKIRKTVSVLVSYHLKSIVEMKTKRVKSEERNREAIIYNINLDRSSENIMEPDKEYRQKNVENMLSKLFEKTSLSLPERYIVLWKLQIKQKEEVKELLGITSDATLYNRWSKVWPKLLETFYKDKELKEEL